MLLLGWSCGKMARAANMFRNAGVSVQGLNFKMEDPGESRVDTASA